MVEVIAPGPLAVRHRHLINHRARLYLLQHTVPAGHGGFASAGVEDPVGHSHQGEGGSGRAARHQKLERAGTAAQQPPLTP